MNVIFLRGLPGSGKSELVKIISEEKRINVISKDTFRFVDDVYHFDKENEKNIAEKCLSEFNLLLDNKEDNIFIDNLNLTQKSMSPYLEIAKKHDCRILYINFEPRELDFHERNNTKGISEIELKIFKKQYQPNASGADVVITLYDFANKTDINKILAFLEGTNDKKIESTKGTLAEVELRIATVYEMVVKGASRAYIVRFCAKEWNLKPRQVDVYLKRVYKQIKITYDDSYRELIIQKQMAQLDDLYVKNYTIEDFRECRNIIESRSKLLGLNAPAKIEHSGGISFEGFLTNE